MIDMVENRGGNNPKPTNVVLPSQEQKGTITIPKKAFKHLIGNAVYPLAIHTFMGNCLCDICKVLRAFEIDDYEDYMWLITQLNNRRNIRIEPMTKELFNISHTAVKKAGRKIVIDV